MIINSTQCELIENFLISVAVCTCKCDHLDNEYSCICLDNLANEAIEILKIVGSNFDISKYYGR